MFCSHIHVPKHEEVPHIELVLVAILSSRAMGGNAFQAARPCLSMGNSPSTTWFRA